MASTRRPRVGFVLEQALGHAAHAKTLGRLLPEQEAVDAVVAEIPYEVVGAPARVPGYGNWTVRAGVRARRAIRSMRRSGPLDALFVHTQVPAVLLPDIVARIPTVVSLDATPLQYDELGAHYDHHPGPEPVERAKWRATKWCFDHAAHLVTWSTWAKDGLASGYGIDGARVSVIPPGVEGALWRPTVPRGHREGPVRVLFVGGDFERKGGSHLLRAVRALQAEQPGRVQLDVVTRDDVPAGPGVAVHHGLGPGDARLVQLFHDADVFCLPTSADCLAIVLVEAAAAGLPIVATDVGGVTEVCQDGRTGVLVDPADDASLTAALRRLVDDEPLRFELGAAASALAADRFDAATNVAALADLLASVARRAS